MVLGLSAPTCSLAPSINSISPTSTTTSHLLFPSTLSHQSDLANSQSPSPRLIDVFERYVSTSARSVTSAAVLLSSSSHSTEAESPVSRQSPDSRISVQDHLVEIGDNQYGGRDKTLAAEDGDRREVIEGQTLIRRWEGWDTTTTTVYVTNTQEVPTAITLSTTVGENPVINGGTTIETIYKGASTLTVAGPSYLTLTFYPTTTQYYTSKTTIATATKTATQGPSKPQAQESSGSGVCNPGDADVKEKTGLSPTHDQSITLYVIAIFASRFLLSTFWLSSSSVSTYNLMRHSIIGIAIGWNLFILRDLLYPFKVLTVAIHEIGHVFATIILGYRIGFFSIDPKLGGATRIYVGEDREHPLPFAALPAGYVFSIFIGGVLTFCGFNTLASKIASVIIGLCWIAVFLRVGTAAKAMTIGAAGLMVGLWFVDHAWPLRLYILFIGVMSSFYVLWDAADDAFFAKQYPCCPALFFQQIPALNPGLWTLIWFLISFLFFIGFVLAGLANWKQSDHAMKCQADTFLA
ncbi:hypothetical protein JCM3765_001358 [Sporobolomyces pararoseus]